MNIEHIGRKRGHRIEHPLINQRTGVPTVTDHTDHRTEVKEFRMTQHIRW